MRRCQASHGSAAAVARLLLLSVAAIFTPPAAAAAAAAARTLDPASTQQVAGAAFYSPLAAARAFAAPSHWHWPWPWPHPGPEGHDPANTEWQRTLELLWQRAHDQVGFCVGSSARRAERLIGLSFPWPLPESEDPSDALCSNSTRIDAHLCGPQEIEQFYKFMLLTESPEKVPDNEHCSAGGPGQPGCSPGFFDQRLENRPASVLPQQAHPCCDGYFCPPQLTCMLPCPLGSYCPRAHPAPPPEWYQHGDAQWCAPYAYKLRPELGCGGADKWRIVPGSAFPAAQWDDGSGSIYCNGGHFCPNTTAMLSCPPGHFCRQGSTEPDRCPPGVACPAFTEIPENNLNGVTVDALLFGLLWLSWLVSRQYNRVLQRLSKRERLKITWGSHGEPHITVVTAAAGGSSALRAPHSRTHSRSRSVTHSRSHSLQPGHSAGSEAATAGAAVADVGASHGGGRGKGLLGRRGSRRATLGAAAAAGASKAGQVWAAWSGPEGEAAENGYEPLLDGAPPELPSPRLPPRRSSAGAEGGDSVELSPPRRPLCDGGLHARHISIDNEDELTPHHLHSILVGQHRQSLLSAPLSNVHAGAGVRKAALHVEFQELGLRLKSCGKSVLAGVTGVLAASKITAIMGPSGAGKTTLLNVLADKAAAYGVQTGMVLVNGRPDKLERYRRVMGFVPQNDIMYATLTVYENLLFSARFRLPARWTREQRVYQVERAITVLGLDDVRDEVVGNEETRGISGGQKKRVNVGLELVADPSLLFLDEPTSGLDSSSSKSLVAALQAVVRAGVTAAAVIHQPSWQTCLLFDDLLLLGKGGRTVFYGQVDEMQPYFEGLGFGFPLQQNPVDSCMDIVSGAVMREGQASFTELFDLWDDFCGRPRMGPHGLATVLSCDDLPASLVASSATAAASGTLGEPPAPAALLQPPGQRWQGGPGADCPGLEGGDGGGGSGQRGALLGGAEGRQSWWRRVREAVIFGSAFLAAGATDAWRTLRQALQHEATSRAGGAGLPARHGASPTALSHSGHLSSDEDGTSTGASRGRPDVRRATPGFLPQYWWSLGRAVLKRSREPWAVATDYVIVALTGMTLGLISDRGRNTIMHFAVSITYSVVALGLMSTVGALNTFGSDRVVFFREAASGLNRLSHFLALETFDHVGTVLRSTTYFVMYYSFASPRAVIWQMLLVSMAITYSCTGLAYVLSQLMDPAAAQLSAAVLALINTLIARQGHARGLIKLAQSFSFARWGLEGYVISESNKLTGVWLLARCADLQGLEYDVRRFGMCLLALCGLGLLFRAAALLAMLTLHRDKQR